MPRLFHPCSRSATALRLPFLEGHRWITYDKIIRLEGIGNYTTCFLNDGSTVLVALTLKRLHDRLPAGAFVRIHRKHIVNWTFVSSVSPATMAACLTNGERVCISRRRVAWFKRTK